MLDATPRNASLRSLWREAVGALARTENEALAIQHILDALERYPFDGVDLVAPLVNAELSFGHRTIPMAILDHAPTEPAQPSLLRLRHNIAARLGDADRATRIADEAVLAPDLSPEDSCHLVAEHEITTHQPHHAVERLRALRPERSRRYGIQLTTALRALGRHREILDYLDSVRHGLGDIEIELRYDALLALGDVEAARRLADSIGVPQLGSIRALRVRHHAATGAGADRFHQLHEDVLRFEATEELKGQHASRMLTMYFELGLLDEMERIERSCDPSTLPPAARFELARLHYCRRRFDDARRLLDTLTGTDDRWDAEKLRARILLETGDPLGAEARRRANPTIGDSDLDEVHYHALLKQGRLEEAFRMFSPPRDQSRLRSVFAEKADNGQQLRFVQRRMVIAQGGPGDEIMSAALFAQIRKCSERLTVTTDPRLAPLFGRSFPDIDFVPVERLRPRSSSVYGPDGPPRADNVLFDLLTEEAFQEALASDSVVMAKSLQHLAIGNGPFAAFLSPDPVLVAGLRRRGLHGDRPLVGVAWRSELRSPMRDIHYLEVGDLAPVLALNIDVVSLQYDATEDERATLTALSRGRVHFPDDLDLRNDFEVSAALSAGLDAVVGVGTTAVELASAVGVPGVMLQPSHFTTWRSVNDRGADFWHSSLRLAMCDRPWNRDVLALAGARALEEALDASVTPTARR